MRVTMFGFYLIEVLVMLMMAMNHAVMHTKLSMMVVYAIVVGKDGSCDKVEKYERKE